MTACFHHGSSPLPWMTCLPTGAGFPCAMAESKPPLRQKPRASTRPTTHSPRHVLIGVPGIGCSGPCRSWHVWAGEPKYDRKPRISKNESRPMSRRREERLGSRSIHKIEGHTFVAVQKPDKLAKVGRGNVVVDGAEVSVIGHVQRVDAQAEVVLLTALPLNVRDAEGAVSLKVQGEKFREAAAIGSADVLLTDSDR